jgi:hypothetical protein
MFSSWMTSGRLCNGAQVTVAASMQAHQLVGLLAAMFSDPAPPPLVYLMYRQPLAMRVSRNLSSSFSGWERALRLAIVVPARPFSIHAAELASVATGRPSPLPPKLLKASSTCCWLPRARA